MDEALPKMLCTECFSFVTSLVNFSERVGKVQEMFQALKNHRDSKNLDIYNIRANFGVLDNDREHIFIPQTSLLEVNYFDSKRKFYGLEEKIFEDELVEPENPLEPQSFKFEIDKEMAFETDYKPTSSKIKNKLTSESENDSGNDQPDDIKNCSKPIAAEIEVCALNQALSSFPLKVKLKKKSRVISKNKLEFQPRNNEGKNDGIQTRNEACSTKIPKKNQKKHRESVYSCSECSKNFKHIQPFRQHMKRTHLMSPTDWKCNHCPGRVFLTQYQLDRHHKIHLPSELKRTVPCPCCNKKFSSNSIVQTHIKFIHNNDRSFICEECGVTMRTNAALKAHMLTHTDYAPFECKVCKKGFKNQIRLKNHMEIHDPHKHICAECGVQLNSRATLNRHLLVHSDLMQHKCDYCGRAFKRAKALKTHLILHTGLKPYSCDFCDRTFANGSNCRSHKKKVHPEELAALEASGGGKQYTRNIPKLEALKAVTKSADNLAPVVSKQSGRFALGKKIKPILMDAEGYNTQFYNYSLSKSPDILNTAVTNTHSYVDIHQKANASLPIVENICNQFLKHEHEAQKILTPGKREKETTTGDSSTITLPDVTPNRQQLLLQTVQSSHHVTSLSVPCVNLMQNNSNNTEPASGFQLSKFSDLSKEHSTLLFGTLPQKYSPHSFLCQRDGDLQYQDPSSSESQTSVTGDKQKQPPSRDYYSQGTFM